MPDTSVCPVCLGTGYPVELVSIENIEIVIPVVEVKKPTIKVIKKK